MEVKIGVQNAARELSVETDAEPDSVLEQLQQSIKDEVVFSLTDDKGRTVAVPADKVAYLYFTADAGRKVGFGLVPGKA
ncbi:MAG: DUF3107 domain-containing protein [Actinomycetales bacterium]|nr:MAG: DUF3107 domain-containing protein [Actinomycetales bacterium]